jgi:hypothetical protein
MRFEKARQYLIDQKKLRKNALLQMFFIANADKYILGNWVLEHKSF